MGDIEASNNLFDMVGASQRKKDDDIGEWTDEVPLETKLKEIEARFSRFKRSNLMKSKPDLLIKNLQRDLIDVFQKAAIDAKRCENCSAFSPPIRKDGASKIFQKPIPMRQRKSMSSSLRQKVSASFTCSTCLTILLTYTITIHRLQCML